MTDTNDTQALHNSFVEPLQVETSNNTTNPHCAKLSPEEISIDSQESLYKDRIILYQKRWTYKIPKKAIKQKHKENWGEYIDYWYVDELKRYNTDKWNYTIISQYMISKEDFEESKNKLNKTYDDYYIPTID